MNDRKLLGLAAKAAAIGAVRVDTEYEHCFKIPSVSADGRASGFDIWDPLTDDGDAFRLLVDLRLVVHVWDDQPAVSAAKTLPDGEQPADDSEKWEMSTDTDDIRAAARRAIVLVAAEIGKELP
jgi:hypothetical protein